MGKRHSRLHEPNRVLATLQAAEAELVNDVRLLGVLQVIDVRYRFISDTIVIAVTSRGDPHEPDDAQPGAAIHGAAMAAETIVKFLMRADAPLTAQGVRFGKFLLARNHVIGPAIDESAMMLSTLTGLSCGCSPNFGNTW